MGSARVAFVLLSLEEHNFAEVGTFQPSLGFKDFHQAARLMSSHSPHASRPSTFRAPGWGALALLSSCHRWRNVTSRKLVPFSHRSASRIFIRQPGYIPSPVVTQDGDHQFDGGEKRAGLRPLPRPQSPGMGSARVAFVLSSLEECNFAEVGTFQPSLGFKDFHQAAWLHPLAGGHPRR